MYITGIQLNIFNQSVLPTILGIGIDNAVHMQHRYDAEGRKVKSILPWGEVNYRYDDAGNRLADDDLDLGRPPIPVVDEESP